MLAILSGREPRTSKEHSASKPDAHHCVTIQPHRDGGLAVQAIITHAHQSEEPPMSQPPHVPPQQCVVAQLGGPAVMIRGGSRRVWCHFVRRRLGGCR